MRDRDKNTQFIYNVNFTNTTAVAAFEITVPEGVLSIFFEGAREDEHRDFGYSSPATPDPGDWREKYHPIWLQVPAGSRLPKFTEPDGTGFIWGWDYQGRNDVTDWPLSGNMASRGVGAGGMVVAAVAACLFLI